MKIYPLQFEKIIVNNSWGDEELLLCDNYIKSKVKNGELKNKDFTYVMNHYAKNLIGEDKFIFPLLVKKVNVKEESPIHVHPSNKSELIYALNNSKINGGVKSLFDKEKLKDDQKILLDNIKNYDLNASDICYIKPGTLHQLEKDLSCFVITDNIDATYNLYDSKNNNLNLKQGIESFMPLSDLEISNKANFDGKIYAKVEMVEGRKIIEEDESYKIIIPLEGKLAIETNTDFFDMDNLEVTLVPYDVTGYSIVGYGKYLDIKPNMFM
ncbi:MAG: hypothetical protein MJ245_01295 [Clostridia bacterium]|nr:hypothetical protein [Clostridia bacterium]